jgi:hypothetical protein
LGLVRTSEWSGRRGAFEFDYIAFRIRDVEGRPFAFRPIARFGWTSFNVVRSQVSSDARFMEWLNPEAEVIQVPRLPAGCGPARLAEPPCDGHQVKQGTACPQLKQPNIILASLDRAAQRITVEAQHLLEIKDSKHKMVDFAKVDHGFSGISASTN